MSFTHLAQTVPGAPDEIVNWFAIFEAWITGLGGWYIVSGAGTTDIVIRSIGEAGTYSMLYAHVWRDGGNPNRVRVEVQDDAAGTHVTTQDGWVDSGGGAFDCWMSADKNHFVIVWLEGANYKMLWAGVTYSFALHPPDETYSMVSMSGLGLNNATVLRRADGVWDQNLHPRGELEWARTDQNDGSFPLGACKLSDTTAVVGQFQSISYWIRNGGAWLALEDTIDTGHEDLTNWIVLQEKNLRMFALRTGGVEPVGRADGNFSHESGLVATVADFYNIIIPAFLTAVGWTVDDMPGSPFTHDKRCNSPGEDGTDDIWIRLGWQAGATLLFAMDDAVGTHVTGAVGDPMVASWFPTFYWITADLDSVIFTLRRDQEYPYHFAGKLLPAAPGLPDVTYSMVTSSPAQSRVLRNHAGAWNQIITRAISDAVGSNPNDYDAITYLVWNYTYYVIVGGGWEIYGSPKYFGYSGGPDVFGAATGGVGVGDLIPVGDAVYQVFFDNVDPWVMRIG